jgi:hypothetical protein
VTYLRRKKKEVACMSRRAALNGLFGPAEPKRTIVREYGRDSLLVWANLLLAPLFAALGMRVGVQSEERLAAKIETDAAAMRSRGYLVASTQTFSLPVIGAPRQTANWYRVTFELASPERR